jgi:hypothetical protein
LGTRLAAERISEARRLLGAPRRFSVPDTSASRRSASDRNASGGDRPDVAPWLAVGFASVVFVAWRRFPRRNEGLIPGIARSN